MQQKSFTLDGRRYRLDALVPAYDIERRVAREHVGTDDIRIAKIIGEAWGPAELQQTNPRFNRVRFLEAAKPQ